jgi:toxin ParE1/3/4
MQIMLRPLAEVDLSDIWDYTEETWGPRQAREYFAELDRIFQSIVSFPEMARQRTEFDPPVRIHRFRKHLIIYLINDNQIDVIRVLHSRSNWTALLAE